MDVLKNLLELLLETYKGLEGDDNDDDSSSRQQRQFVPRKAARLRERDYTIIDMLNSASHEDVSFCVCDPALPDCPIVFASDGFCRFTGYDHEEIEGKNCRFLQGAETSKDDVDRIRKAIANQQEASVNLLNYRKDGTAFNNQFFLAPLYDESGQQLLYFLGCQCSVARLGPGQGPSNHAWIYAQGLHA